MRIMDKLRLWLDRRGDSFVVDPVKMAETRWRARNAEARRKCFRCDRVPTEVYYDYQNIGSVPVEFWYCTTHDPGLPPGVVLRQPPPYPEVR